MPVCRSVFRTMSAGAMHLCHSEGRVWFEVEGIETSQEMAVGFAGTNFLGAELGADERGWGIDDRCFAKHG